MSEALAPPPREEVASEGNQPAASRPGRKKPSSSVPPAETPAATPGKMPRPKIGPACVRTPIGRDLGRGVSRTFVRGRTVRRGCGGDSASGSGDSSVGVSAPGASAAGGDGSVAPRRAIVRSIDMLVASAAATLKVAHPSGPEAISCAASLGRSGSVRTIDARSCEPLRTMRVVTAIGFAPPDGANGSNARRWRRWAPQLRVARQPRGPGSKAQRSRRRGRDGWLATPQLAISEIECEEDRRRSRAAPEARGEPDLWFFDVLFFHVEPVLGSIRR